MPLFWCWLSFLESGKLKWDDSAHNLETRKGRLSVAAACCEWVACFLIVIFTASFVPEFRHYDMKRAGVSLKKLQNGSTNNGGAINRPSQQAQRSSGNGSVHTDEIEMQNPLTLEVQENHVLHQNHSWQRLTSSTCFKNAISDLQISIFTIMFNNHTNIFFLKKMDLIHLWTRLIWNTYMKTNLKCKSLL